MRKQLKQLWARAWAEYKAEMQQLWSSYKAEMQQLWSAYRAGK